MIVSVSSITCLRRNFCRLSVSVSLPACSTACLASLPAPRVPFPPALPVHTFFFFLSPMNVFPCLFSLLLFPCFFFFAFYFFIYFPLFSSSSNVFVTIFSSFPPPVSPWPQSSLHSLHYVQTRAAGSMMHEQRIKTRLKQTAKQGRK